MPFRNSAFQLGLVLFLFTQAIGVQAQSLMKQSLAKQNKQLPSLIRGGHLRSVLYIEENDEGKAGIQSGWAEAALLLSHSGDHSLRAFADLRLRSGSAWNSELSPFQLREAWIRYKAGILDFHMGREISPLGKTTVFNPVDKKSPINPLVRSPEDDDRYLGTWAAGIDCRVSRMLSLSIEWNPLYTPSRTMLSRFPLPEYMEIGNPEYPGNAIKETTLSFSADLHHNKIDASIYALRGPGIWPGIQLSEIEFDPLLFIPTRVVISERSYHINMLGGDFSLPAGPFVFRGEAAWQDVLERHNSQAGAALPELSYTFEFEFMAGGLDFVAGYYGKHILNYSAPKSKARLSVSQDEIMALLPPGENSGLNEIQSAAEQQLESFNRLYNYQYDEHYHSLYLVLEASAFQERLRLSCPLINHLSTSEWILKPSLSWMPGNNFAIKAGYTAMYGPEDSLAKLAGRISNALFVSLSIKF